MGTALATVDEINDLIDKIETLTAKIDKISNFIDNQADLMSIDEFAKKLGRTKRTIYQYIADGLLTPIVIANQYRFSRKMYEELQKNIMK